MTSDIHTPQAAKCKILIDWDMDSESL